MTHSTPQVRSGMLAWQPAANSRPTPIAVGTAAWYAWLDAHQAFALSYHDIHVTARKERRAGSFYWYAYRHHHGTLRSAYLGKSEDLTLKRLTTVAQRLATTPAPIINQVGRTGEADRLALPRMDEPLLTKLTVPPVRRELVARGRLLDQLTACGRRPLTLVSAPAGFGKTTLLSAWLARNDERGTMNDERSAAHVHRSSFIAHRLDVAWVSLEVSDNDPTRFWSAIIAALETQHPGVGTAAHTLLRSPQSASTESVLTALINALATISDDLMLVLDDYHLIESPAIHQGLTFLLDHLPPQLHLVLATRTAPPLPLARLRARGHLIELRAADLRFTGDEATAFLTDVMGLSIAPTEIAILETRTEGWIAGLQLAALALQGQTDIPGKIAAFAGDHCYILDYLTDEVLAHQPEAVQTFLMQTSILDQLSGPLCDAVTGRTESQSLLEQLERANLFLVPLDGARRLYRYHHLFADVLRQRLQQAAPDQVPTFHHRASVWYEQHGAVEAAIAHALVAGTVERAADLIEQCITTWCSAGELATLRGWLEALPDEVVQSRPQLCLAHAGTLLFTGRLDMIEARLQDAEQHLEPANPRHTDRHNLQGQATAIRALLACYRSEAAWANDLARQALATLPQDAVLVRAMLALTLALNLADPGGAGADVAAAQQILDTAIAVGQVTDDPAAVLIAHELRAELAVAQGQLHAAAASYHQAQDLAQHLPDADGQPAVSFAGAACIGLGGVLREWNMLDAARQTVTAGLELAYTNADPWTRSVGSIVLAHIHQAQGEHDTAHTLLAQAAQFAHQAHISWLSSRVAASQARLWLAQGNHAAASRWAAACALRVGDAIGYQRVGEYTTLARVYIAEGRLDDACMLLAWLCELTERAGLDGMTIEILAVQALAHVAHSEMEPALVTMARALALAEPAGYIRVFVDEGAPMAALLQEAHVRGIAQDYTARLLAAFSQTMKDERGTMKEDLAAHRSSLIVQPLVEPLSMREQEVLQLIATGRSNQAIAAQLIIAAGTVKRHITNIYGKLGVHSRTQAVARARAMHLLPL